jgi:hypothetical protein
MRFLSDRVRWPLESDRVAGGNLPLWGLDRRARRDESPGLNRSPAFIPHHDDSLPIRRDREDSYV